MRRFYVSNLEGFSFCRKRQYSYNERNTLKFRGNCERNFDRAFFSSFKTIFFSVRSGKGSHNTPIKCKQVNVNSCEDAFIS